MPDILNIALSGLLTHQNIINVTGQNIANSSNDDYSRQIALAGTRTPEFKGGLFFGTGVDVTAINRATDAFVLNQLRRDTSNFSQSELLRQQLDQLDLLFSNEDTGLSSSLRNFFSALQGANDDPTSISARQVLLSSADSLVNKFKAITFQLENQQRNVDSQIQASAAKISSLAEALANVNQQIAEVSGIGGGALPNDLIDQRDALLKDLAEQVGISTIDRPDGTVDVFIGSGQALVLGNNASALITRPSQFNPQRLELAVQSGNVVTGLGGSLSGGVMGGLLQFDENILTESINTLGRVALTVIGTMNDQHQLGMDLQGQLGGDFFADINSATAVANRVLASSANSIPPDHVVNVNIADLSQLSTSDYRITFTGPTTYQIIRLSDNAVNTAIDPGLTGTIGGLPAVLQFDGLDVALDRPSGNFAAGDTFLLQPTRSAGSDISLALTSPAQLALASPIATSDNINNQGAAIISAGRVTDVNIPLFATPGQLSPPLLIQFTSATTYDILDNSTPGAPVPLVPPQAGLAYPPPVGTPLVPASFGIEVEITGLAQAGDSFTIDFNSNGFQDNRNGLALTQLQTQPILDNGTISIEGGYARLLQQVGTQTATARQNEAAAQSLLQQSQTQRDAISGVNLDEEAAKLIELQQAYGASAQVISVARSLFDTLLSAVG